MLLLDSSLSHGSGAACDTADHDEVTWDVYARCRQDRLLSRPGALSAASATRPLEASRCPSSRASPRCNTSVVSRAVTYLGLYANHVSVVNRAMPAPSKLGPYTCARACNDVSRQSAVKVWAR